MQNPEIKPPKMMDAIWPVLDSMRFGVVLIQTDGVIAGANRAAMEMFGYDSSDLIYGRCCAGLLCRKTDLSRCLPQEGGSFSEDTMLYASGRDMRVLKSTSLLAGQNRSMILEVFLDITEFTQARESLTLLEKAARTTRTGMTISNVEGIILYTNQADAEMHGYRPEELLGRHVSLFVPHVTMTPLSIDDLRELKTWTRESFNSRKDGSLFPVRLISDVVINESGDPIGIVTTCEDITERKLSEKKLIESRQHLYHMAHHDILTGLPNRILFNDRLTQALSLARRNKTKLAVLLCDLDNFKEINDTLGHTVGDSLLQMATERLQESIRESDTLARLGGDEFCVILPEINRRTDSEKVARKLLKSMEKPLVVEGREIYVTFSIGLATFPEDGDDGMELLKNADTALYCAKGHGRNNIQAFRKEMNDRNIVRMETATKLRKALERDELELYYQPQVCTKTGKVTCLEALVRWNDPERGQVSPVNFIAIAEETGLIVPIGDWVIRRACKQGVEWLNKGYKVRIAVNLSAQQFRQSDIIDTVSNALYDFGLPPNLLELEITESAMMHNLKTVLKILERLASLGVKIAVDDFGIGYSSLSYLKKFPIHSLKIDKAFVSDVALETDDAAIATAIVALAKSLKLEVVAEGVETERQLEFLRALGCDRIQGYLFSTPIPPEVAEAYMEEEKG